MKDPYSVLGVSKTAPAEEIKKAYRKLAKKLHPDMNQGDKKSEERFKEVSNAFEVLGDPKRRALYDEFGELATKPGFDEEKARQARAWQQQAERGGGFPGFEGFSFRGRPGRFDPEDLSSMFGDLFARQQGRARRAAVEPADGDDAEAAGEGGFPDAVTAGERRDTLHP